MENVLRVYARLLWLKKMTEGSILYKDGIREDSKKERQTYALIPVRGGSRSTWFQKGTWSGFSHLGRKRLVDILNQEGMGKIHFAFICLACEIIRFFRLKFLVSPPEKTRNLSRKNRMLLQAIICRTSLNFARQEHCKTQSLTETSRGFSAVSVVEKAQRQGVRSSCVPNLYPPRCGYSTQWPIRGGSARKGYLF